MTDAAPAQDYPSTAPILNAIRIADRDGSLRFFPWVRAGSGRLRLQRPFPGNSLDCFFPAHAA